MSSCCGRCRGGLTTWWARYSQSRTEAGSFRAFSYPNYADLRDESGLFDGLVAQRFATIGTTVGEETRRSLAALVSSNYFDTLGVRLAAGRTFTAEEERPGAGIPVAIATYQSWQKEQLDPAFIGRTIRINARDFTVVGIAPEGFTGTMVLVSADVYLPLGVFDTVVSTRPAAGFVRVGGKGLGDRSNHSLAVAGRLKPGLTDAFVSARLEAVSRQLEAAYPGENKDQALSVMPLPRIASSPTPDADSGLGTFSALLLGLSGVVLVIACLNVANMLLARGAARSKELAVRLALGAGRARIIRQLLTEGILLAMAGAGLGLVFSYWATRALATSLMSAFPYTLSLNAAPDVRVLAATLGFAALGTIAFGLGPALRLSRRDLVADLKDRGGEGASIWPALRRAQPDGHRAGGAVARAPDRRWHLRAYGDRRERRQPRLLLRPSAPGQPRQQPRWLRRDARPRQLCRRARPRAVAPRCRDRQHDIDAAVRRVRSRPPGWSASGSTGKRAGAARERIGSSAPITSLRSACP